MSLIAVFSKLKAQSMGSVSFVVCFPPRYLYVSCSCSPSSPEWLLHREMYLYTRYTWCFSIATLNHCIPLPSRVQRAVHLQFCCVSKTIYWRGSKADINVLLFPQSPPTKKWCKTNLEICSKMRARHLVLWQRQNMRQYAAYYREEKNMCPNFSETL